MTRSPARSRQTAARVARKAAKADIAIIGMACMFPGARDLQSYWNNILGKVNAVGQPLPDWGAQRYGDAGTAKPRVSTSAGGFLRELYTFDSLEFGIMPRSVDGGEPDQFLALQVAHDALRDAGYLDHDHAATGVVLGHSTYLHRGNAGVVQHGVVLDQTIELLAQVFPAASAEDLARARVLLQAKLPPFNADIAPGLVPNVMTGRIANRLNLKGPNYLIDAACASSLLAVQAGIEELRRGTSDLMLVGGVNASMPAEVLMVFTELGALSKSSRIQPFDTGADGTLLGEGLGIVVLKRLDEAVRDGDRIYAMVKDVGVSSDGRALGLLTPNLEGEVLAIERAYRASGVAPESVGLLEAHGTGIALGDRTEIQALRRVFGDRDGELPSCAIGSVKSMISHCIPAAGAAGLIKTALALYHRVLPPTLCAEPNAQLELEQTPFYVNTETRPWIHSPEGPRRAAVNAFGFGGINTHAVLEEFNAAAEAREAAQLHWPTEIVVFGASARDALLAQMRQVRDFLERDQAATLRDIAFTASQAKRDGPLRLALIVHSRADLEEKLGKTLERLADPSCDKLQTRSGVYFSAAGMPGRLALLFPGEGAQYPGMLGDLAQAFPSVRGWFDFWDGIFGGERGAPSSTAVFQPPNALDAEARKHLEAQLYSLRIGSESMFIANQAMFGLLRELGIEADDMLGHSSGENSALVAAGVIRIADRAELREHILRLNRMYEQMESDGDIARGALLTIGAVRRETILEMVERSGGKLHLALDNCRHQTVLFGSREDMERAAGELRKAGGLCVFLPFDRAYHTPLFAPVAEAVERFLADVDFGPGSVPVYSCVDARPFPAEASAIRHHTAVQWSSCVRFIETIERMYEDGCRHFVEIGPSGNLTTFVDDILRDREHLAVAANSRHRSGLLQLQHLLGRLYVAGRDPRFDKLYERRAAQRLDWDAPQSARASRARPVPNVLPYIRLEHEEAQWLHGVLAPQVSTADADRVPALVSPFESEAMPTAAAAADAVPEWPLAGAAFTQDYVAEQETMAEAGHDLASEGDALDWPFLQRVVELNADEALVEFDLDVSTQRFLRDHVLYARHVSELDPELQALPVVPLTVSMEMLIEVAGLLSDKPWVAALENVKAHNWVAVEQGTRTVQLRARRGSEPDRILGSVCDGDSVLLEAEVLFADGPAVEGATLPPLANPRPPVWSDDQLYTSGMFHGPLFHSVQHLIAWDDTGMDLELGDTPTAGFFDGHASPGMFLNPVLLDAVGHLTAFWIAQQKGTDFSSFPSRIARIEFLEPGREDTAGCRLRGRLRYLQSGSQSRFLEGDYDCVDPEGRTLFRIRGWRDRFFDVPHSFYVARTNPRDGWYGEDWSGLFPDLGEDTLVWFLPPFPAGFLEDAGAVWKRLLAFTVLSREERAIWHALPVQGQRRSEWLLGRLALKEAVRYWILKRDGVLLYPADVSIETGASGEPIVGGVQLEGFELPQISLAHVAGICVAVAAPPDQSVGIDLETFGRVRLEDFLDGALTASERARVIALPVEGREEFALRLWCAKEAAAKSLGTGLNGRPAAFQVKEIDASGARALVDAGHAQISVAILRQDEKIVALARGPG